MNSYSTRGRSPRTNEIPAAGPPATSKTDPQANARLIAAAPELLALLVESQESIGGDWRERRDAVIAKATGQ